jgi:hypothetical protein
VVGLLTLSEGVTLAQLGYYPLPPVVIRRGCAPAEHAERKILDAVDAKLVAELPDAIAAVLEGMEQ